MKYDEKELKLGIKTEKREHSKLKRDAIIQLVKDHLKVKKYYYSDEKKKSKGYIKAKSAKSALVKLRKLKI
jgi:hypothetical protein